MADSEKKKRRSKEAQQLEEHENPVVEPVGDSAAKTKKKSKKVVAEPAEEKKAEHEEVVEVQKPEDKVESSTPNLEGVSEPSTDDTAAKSKKKSKKSVSEPEKAKIEDEEPSVEAKAEEKSQEESKSGDSGAVGEDAAVKSKGKSKKASQESSEEPAKAEAHATEEKTKPQAAATENDAEKKPKKRSASKTEPQDANKADDSIAAQSAKPSNTSAPKRRQSFVGKLFDKLMGKGEAKEKPKEKPKAKEEKQDPAKEAKTEKDVEEVQETKAPRKSKKRPASVPPLDHVEPEPVPEGNPDDEYEYDEEEVYEEAPAPLALPKMPPPSAPKKAPAGPVKQGPDVTSVFSMKPQIKVEVGEVEQATEYDAEDVKRTVDFSNFCAAHSQYTIGGELAGTAYNREWEADSTQSPQHVVIKFYSNEPPRLINDARIRAHISLVQSLSPHPHILPLLDDFVGEVYDEPVKSKGKDSASSSEHVDEPAAEPVEVVEVEEKAPVKKKKKSKKEGASAEESGSAEANAPTNPAPAAASAPPPTNAEQKEKKEEHDHFLVFERQPDAAHYALQQGESYSERHVAGLVSGVLKALERVHEAGYMHRAVAPTNVVVNEAGEARLTGFEMACKVSEPEGVVLTSEKFKAPEITHEPQHNQMVDLWGVGVLTYFLLTGRQVFREPNNARLKIAIREASVNYDPEDWDHLSPSAKEFCQALIVRDPAARMTLEQASKHTFLVSPTETKLPRAIEHLKA